MKNNFTPYNHIILILICCFIVQTCFGQNLVLNSSFESYSVCPFNSSNMQEALNWYDCSETPDYYNACSNGFVSVPSNVCGYQAPASGDGYAGMLSYGDFNPTLTPHIRELITGTLSVPLSIGTKYFVSFKICLTEMCSHAINRMGAKFLTYLPPSIQCLLQTAHRFLQ